MDSRSAEALRADGDRYFDVNHAGIGTIADPAFDALKMLHGISPITSVLEVGCTNGFRLDRAFREFGSRCVGIEASPAAVDEGRSLFPDVEIRQGLAPEALATFGDSSFDAIVLGHFLYLLPRSDVFTLAAEVDRLLADGGHLVISDFFHPTPVARHYSHSPALRVLKHNLSSPWLWSPTYELVSRTVYPISVYLTDQALPSDWQTVDVLRKLSADQAYPVLPDDVTEPPESSSGP